MAYAVFGLVKTSPACTIARGWVSPYFKKVAASSAPSKLTTKPYQIEPTGYYSFDLDDTDMLGVGSSYDKTKDRIYIAYHWQSDNLTNSNKDSVDITHAAFIDHAMVQADLFELNVTIPPKKAPVVNSYVFPDAELLTRKNYTMSENSITNTSWETGACSTTQISQKLTYDTVGIFDGHQLIPTIYEWDEIAPRTKNPTSVSVSNTSDTYQYDIAGVYTLRMIVREKWNTQTILEKQVTVRYNKPIPDFNWTPTQTNNWDGPKLKGQELITFHNLSSDIDNRTYDTAKWGTEVYTYNWTITDTNQDGTDNTKTYTETSIGFKPTHRFQSKGVKTITLTINWNDGFNDYQETIQKTLTIHEFRIIPEFTQSPLVPENRGQVVTFNPSLTTGDTEQIVQYDWVIDDRYAATDLANDLRTFAATEISKYGEGSSNPSLVVPNVYTFTNTKNPQVKYHSNLTENAAVTITYYDGWKNVTTLKQNVVNKSTYSITPTIASSNWNPLGRHEMVTISNSTSDPLLLQYTVDWYIEDWYSKDAYDNVNRFNSITDNTKIYLAKPNKEDIIHYYQSSGDKSIELVVRYDNGWQERTKSVVRTITPIVYDPPIPKFTWVPLVPISREVPVQFIQQTEDLETRGTLVDWYIQDSFDAFNPDSPDYGSVVDNQTNYIREHVSFEPTHYFQSQDDSFILMNYYYDDGFEEQYVTTDDMVTKTKHVITAEWDTTISNEELYGKNPYNYINLTVDVNGRTLPTGEKWTFIDNSGISADTLTAVFNDHPKYTELTYTYEYPSRLPFTMVNGATASNYNKEVTLEITYDNGWNNVTKTNKTRMLEAKPYEIVTGDIIYETNV